MPSICLQRHPNLSVEGKTHAATFLLLLHSGGCSGGLKLLHCVEQALARKIPCSGLLLYGCKCFAVRKMHRALATSCAVLTGCSYWLFLNNLRL